MTFALLVGKSARCKLFGNRRGSEILELGLLLGPVLLIVLGGLDFGYYLYVQHNCQSAAREGARAGIVEEDVAQAVEKIMVTNAGFKAGSYRLNVAESTSEVTVRVEMDYQALGIFAPEKMKIVNGVTTMRLEPKTAPAP